MRVVFDGPLAVSYAQAYVDPQDAGPDVDHQQAFAGQVNGLLGAGAPGSLYLTTGLYLGEVGFRLVLADQAPVLGDEWEDVVETSFVPEGPLAVTEWGGGSVCDFALPPKPHRARYCARGMDAGRDADTKEDGVPVDHYELTFWPADPAPDQIVRQGSQSAAYWHNARNHLKKRERESRALWRESPPSDRLVGVPDAQWLVSRRLDLAERLAVASPATQRALAYEIARKCCEEAGLEEQDWVAQALRLQARNWVLSPDLPESYEVQEAAETVPSIRALSRDPAPRRTRNPERRDREAKSYAVMALTGSDHEKPLRAVLRALTYGAQVFAGEQLLDEVAESLSAREEDPGAADPRHDPYNGDYRARNIWGDEPPHPRLVEVNAHQLADFDLPLAERLAEAEPERQRAIACWAARRAVVGAGLDHEFPEIALALHHLDQGKSLPPPFDGEEGEEFALLDSGSSAGEEEEVSLTWTFAEEGTEPEFPPTPVTPESEVSKEVITVDGIPNFSRPYYTLPVFRQAAEQDPLRAAVQAVWTASGSFGDDHRRSILRECQELLGDSSWRPGSGS